MSMGLGLAAGYTSAATDVPMKFCPKCGVLKPLSLFSRSSANKDGLQLWCRSCQSIAAKARAARCKAAKAAAKEEGASKSDVSTPSTVEDGSTHIRRSDYHVVSASDAEVLGGVVPAGKPASNSVLRAHGFQRCSKCHSILPLSEFTSSSGRVDYYCKECRRQTTSSSRSAASSETLRASNAELKKAMSVEVPAAKVVARNGVPTSESKLPRRLRRLSPPLAADAVPGSSACMSSVDVCIESGVCSDLSDTRGFNPLFEGISSEELFSELEARGFALDGVYRLRVIRERVVR